MKCNYPLAGITMEGITDSGTFTLNLEVTASKILIKNINHSSFPESSRGEKRKRKKRQKKRKEKGIGLLDIYGWNPAK